MLISKNIIEEVKYQALYKKQANVRFAAKRDSINHEKFGSKIFCNSSLHSWIESVNHSKQIELYISGKDTDLSKSDNAIKEYENEELKCKDLNP